jgi:predicted peroxiredoxin
MGVDTTIYFVIRGVTVVKKGAAEAVKIGQFSSLRQAMDQAIRAGVKLAVCEQSCMLLGIDRGDFIPEAKIVGAATLNDLVLDANAVLSF